MTENQISFIIRGCIFNTFRALGPGLLESAYENVLAYELVKRGLSVRQQVALPVIYEEVKLPVGFRVDLIVEDKVLVEIKSVDQVSEVHFKQLITYLKLSGKHLGLLVNFNSADIATGIYRKINGIVS